MARRPMQPRKLEPWRRHHEPWCAIFRGKSCDCDDNGREREHPHHPPLQGGPAGKRERELEGEQV